MTAPSDFPDWATEEDYNSGPDDGTPTKIEPTSGEIQNGNVRGTPPSPQKFNWWQNLVGQWIRHLNEVPDIQAFTTLGAGTWTKPSWATDETPVRVILVPGGSGGAGGSVSNSGGGGGGSIPVFADYFAGQLAATEGVTVGSAGDGGFEGNGANGTTSQFATGKQYISVAATNAGGNINGNGGNGGNGGGAGASGSGGSGGGGGGAGGPGASSTAGTSATPGDGAFSRFGFVGSCHFAGSGGANNTGGGGGVGWGAGGGGGAAQGLDVIGGGGGGAGWTGWPGYTTAQSGGNRTGSSTTGGTGNQGIVVVITGPRVAE